MRLDDAILYLLMMPVAESHIDGYRLPISRVHDVLFSVEDELETDLGVSLNFHDSSERVFPNQIKDLVPYTTPIRNPRFTLEISPDVTDVTSTALETE